MTQNKEKTTHPTRRKILSLAALFGSGLALSGGLGGCMNRRSADSTTTEEGAGTDNSLGEEGEEAIADSDTIPVGILHSLSGPMAISETALVDAEELAIAEINDNGGVLGRQIVAVIRDGASDPPTFTERAENLIDQSQVAVIFGGWTSSSRQAIKSVVEAKDNLLWYPLSYEGQECSKNIFYMGETPNQQIAQAVDWLLENKGKSFFLIGSDPIFSKTVSELIQAQLAAKQGKLVGEEYLLSEGTDVAPIIAKIKQALPEGGVIFSSLQGDRNVDFFRQLKQAGITADKYSVMSVGITEEEIRQIGPEYVEGHYATWSYFQTIDRPENKAWIANFKSQYGDDRVTSDPMQVAYSMVHLWAQAVETAGTTDIEAVRQAAYGQAFEAPGGLMTIEPNHHTAKIIRIGMAQKDGLFEIVSETDAAIEPLAWDQSLPETKGYFCDWSDPSKGGKYKVTS